MMKNLFIAILFIFFSQQIGAQKGMFNDVSFINNDVCLIDYEVTDEVTKLGAIESNTYMGFEKYDIKKVFGVTIEEVIDGVLSNPDFSLEEFDTFQIILTESGETGSTGKMNLMYKKSGELLSVIEKLKDQNITVGIRNAIGLTYPGWSIVSNKYKKVYYRGKVNKENHKITIRKNNKTKKVFTDSCGNII